MYSILLYLTGLFLNNLWLKHFLIARRYDLCDMFYWLAISVFIAWQFTNAKTASISSKTEISQLYFLNVFFLPTIHEWSLQNVFYLLLVSNAYFLWVSLTRWIKYIGRMNSLLSRNLQLFTPILYFKKKVPIQSKCCHSHVDVVHMKG